MNDEISELFKNPQIQKEVCVYLYLKGLVEIPNMQQINFDTVQRTNKPVKVSPIHEKIKIVERYRRLFPAGKKSSTPEVTTKLANLFTNHPHLTGEDVIKATRLYLSELQDFTYCEKAGNFISKRLGSKEVRSTLLEYIERVNDTDVSSSSSSLGKTI